MKAKLACILAAAILLTGLAGCGSPNKNASVTLASAVKETRTAAVSETTTAKANIQGTGIWYNDNVVNILLAGTDSGNRSDALLILSLNSVTKTVNLISLPRATYTPIPGHGSKRINMAYSYGGPTLLKKTIEQNYKIRIDKYVCTGFDGFEKIIDSLGGLTVYWTQKELDFQKDLLRQKGISVAKGAGNYTMDGETALAFARMRKLDSDKNRTERHRRLITALIARVKASSATEIIQLLGKILPAVTTDFTAKELLAQAADALTYSHWTLRETSIPFRGTGLTRVNGVDVLIFNWNTVRVNIHQQLYGGIAVSTS